MKTDSLIAQLEMYSNAIAGFMVLQALGYSFSFGTNAYFNCLVKTATYLAHGLAIHFIVATALTCYATILLGRQIILLSREHQNVLRKIYIAKCAAIALFTSIPFVVTVAYGVLDYPNKFECKLSKRAA